MVILLPAVPMVHNQRIFKPGLVSLVILEEEMLLLFFFFYGVMICYGLGTGKELAGLDMGLSSYLFSY